MEALAFLGGKYQKTEQIVPGPVQTFRAREAASGREVFVHRVSSAEEQAEQTALLRMLTTVLLRSSEARKLVLDFGDDQGFWYVVTASEPRCLVLREWLQRELNPANPASVEEHAPVKAVQEPRPSQVEEEKTEPGEFTRMFQSFSPEPARPAAVSPTTPAATPAPPPTPQSEPGEFTRFFQGGLPPSPSKGPHSPEVKRSQDRPSKGGFVQRPNTPLPPLSQKPSDTGEFTRIFSRPTPDAARPKDPFPDYGHAKQDPANFFSPAADTPKATPPERQEPGEYTRIFGGGTTAPPMPQAPLPQPPLPKPSDDPLLGTRPLPAAPPVIPSAPRGPSEYTMVIQGSRPPEAAGVPASPVAASPAPPHLPAVPPVNLPKPNIPKPPAIPAPAAAALPAVAGSNKKLIVFFAILAVLAIVLILLVVLIAVKK
jgi:hypothetical protein